MFCGNCGKQIPVGFTSCPSCGVSSEGEGGTMNMDVQKFSGNSNPVYSNNFMEKNMTSTSDNNTQIVFLDNMEKKVAEIGSSYMQSFLHGGGLSKGYGIITDKRYYFKGKCYKKQGGQYIKSDEEWCVDLRDITATGFIYSGKIGWIIAAIILLIIGVSAIGESAGLFFAMIIFAGLCIVGYHFTKNVLYIVTCAGCAIGLDVSKYGGTSEVKTFDKKLRVAKDIVLGEYRLH